MESSSHLASLFNSQDFEGNAVYGGGACRSHSRTPTKNLPPYRLSRSLYHRSPPSQDLIPRTPPSLPERALINHLQSPYTSPTAPVSPGLCPHPHPPAQDLPPTPTSSHPTTTIPNPSACDRPSSRLLAPQLPTVSCHAMRIMRKKVPRIRCG